MDRETEALNKVVTDNLAALDAENDAGIESRVAFLADRAALIARTLRGCSLPALKRIRLMCRRGSQNT